MHATYDFFSGLVPSPPRREKLLHAVYVHLDVGRGQLPPAAPHQHVEGENVADLDHHRLMLDSAHFLNRPLHILKDPQSRRGH